MRQGQHEFDLISLAYRFQQNACEASVRPLFDIFDGQLTEMPNHFAQQGADHDHPTTISRPAGNVRLNVEAADTGRRAAANPVHYAGRYPYGSLRWRDEAAAIGMHLNDPFGRIGQLSPAMAVTIAQGLVGQCFSLAIKRPWQFSQGRQLFSDSPCVVRLATLVGILALAGILRRC